MKPSQLQSCVIVADGGCLGNGTANAKAYGSFKVFANGQEVRHHAFDFPETASTHPVKIDTNNKAEYGALAEVILYLEGVFAKVDPFPVKIQMDSALVVNQVSGKHKAKDPQIVWFRDAAQGWLAAHPTVQIERIAGREVKKILGH